MRVRKKYRQGQSADLTDPANTSFVWRSGCRVGRHIGCSGLDLTFTAVPVEVMPTLEWAVTFELLLRLLRSSVSQIALSVATRTGMREVLDTMVGTVTPVWEIWTLNFDSGNAGNGGKLQMDQQRSSA